MAFDRLRYLLTGQWQMADRAARRPGAASTAHQLMSEEDLQWCAERSIQYGAPAVAWWSEDGTQPVISAAQVSQYMQLVDEQVMITAAYLQLEEGWRPPSHRYLQQHQLRYAVMTWDDTILPLLQLDDWSFSQCMVFDHFVRYRLHGVTRPGETYVQQPPVPTNQRLHAIRVLSQRLPFRPYDAANEYRKTIMTLWQMSRHHMPHCSEARAEMISCALRHSRVQIQHFVSTAIPEYTVDGLTWLQVMHKWALELCQLTPAEAVTVVCHMLTLSQQDSKAATEWVELGAILRAACADYAQRGKTSFSSIHGHSNVVNASDEATWHVFIDAIHEAARLKPDICTITRQAQVLLCFARSKLVPSTATERHDLMEVTYAEALRAILRHAFSEGSNATLTTAAARVLSGPQQALVVVQQWQSLLSTISHKRLVTLPLQIVADIYAMACSGMQDAPLQPSDVLSALQLAMRECAATAVT